MFRFFNDRRLGPMLLVNTFLCMSSTLALPISPGELSERVVGTVNATGSDLFLEVAGESFLQERMSPTHVDSPQLEIRRAFKELLDWEGRTTISKDRFGAILRSLDEGYSTDSTNKLWNQVCPDEDDVEPDRILDYIFKDDFNVPGLHLYATEPTFYQNSNIHCRANSGVSAGKAIHDLTLATRAMVISQDKYPQFSKMFSNVQGLRGGDVKTFLKEWFQFFTDDGTEVHLGNNDIGEMLVKKLGSATKVRPRAGNQSSHTFDSNGKNDQRYYIGVKKDASGDHKWDGFRSSGCLGRTPLSLSVDAGRMTESTECKLYTELTAFPVVQAWLDAPSIDATNPALKGGIDLAWKVQRVFVPYLAQIWGGSEVNPASSAGMWKTYLEKAKVYAKGREKTYLENLVAQRMNEVDLKVLLHSIQDENEGNLPATSYLGWDPSDAYRALRYSCHVLLRTHAEFLVREQLGEMQWMTISELGQSELGKNLDGYLFSGHILFKAEADAGAPAPTFEEKLKDTDAFEVFRGMWALNDDFTTEFKKDLSLPENEGTVSAIMSYLRRVAGVTDTVAAEDRLYAKVWEVGPGELETKRHFPVDWKETTSCGKKSCATCLQDWMAALPTDLLRNQIDPLVKKHLCEKMALTLKALTYPKTR